MYSQNMLQIGTICDFSEAHVVQTLEARKLKSVIAFAGTHLKGAAVKSGC